MTPEVIRAVDLATMFHRHREMTGQVDVQIERLGMPGEVDTIVAIARHVGMHPVIVDPATVLRHIDANGMLNDEFYSGRHFEEVVWYKAWMETDMPALILDVTTDPDTTEARRRLGLWIDSESDVMMLLLVDEASGGEPRIARPVI